jgi:hypothetical protein
MRIRDGERIATLAVAGGKVILEIHAPQLIRPRNQRERLGAWGCALPFPLWTGQSRTIQDVAECTGCGPNHVWL